MNIGIYTYGTRGDVQPYVALALGLMAKGHSVTLAAPSDFRTFVTGFGVPFWPLYGEAENMMQSPEGQQVLQTENSIALMKHFFKVLHGIREPLRQSYWDSISQVDYIIANSATLPIVSAIAEKQQKKLALTYFMPPVVPTTAFPLGDFDFLNFPWYNKLTYHIAQYFYWQFVRNETNEYRRELGLPELRENLIRHLDRRKPLDLYCISPSLIPQPSDWDAHHKITGFLTVPAAERAAHHFDTIPPALEQWLSEGSKPVYIGFGSNGVGNQEKMMAVLSELLEKTGERVLFCTGWSVFEALPAHQNLFVAKYVNHEAILPRCKVGVFHGGAGTLATMMRHELPVVVVSFYTDQPTWGKIVVREKLGAHIPVKKLTAQKLMSAIAQVQQPAIKENVVRMGQKIRAEKGMERAVEEIEGYFMG
jgi:UDP:flavonoid glycosyltransferase YjiC (YdhE family)